MEVFSRIVNRVWIFSSFPFFRLWVWFRFFLPGVVGSLLSDSRIVREERYPCVNVLSMYAHFVFAFVLLSPHVLGYTTRATIEMYNTTRRQYNVHWEAKSDKLSLDTPLFSETTVPFYSTHSVLISSRSARRLCQKWKPSASEVYPDSLWDVFLVMLRGW